MFKVSAMTACVILSLLLAGSVGRADTLDRVRQSGVIRWGGDQEGGGPYIYPDPDDADRILGFEVELMELVAERLGVRSEFQQCEWENLPDQLRRGDIDVIVNGYELTANHLTTKIPSIPYYIYELQLIARRDDPSIRSWEDLQSSRRKRVGVLGGSAAETYVRKRLGNAAEVVLYKGSTDAMLEVANGKLDATVQDLPVAIFYQLRYSSLHLVDAPVGRGAYVFYFRPQDRRLRDACNGVLTDLILSGRLRNLYERYGLWNDTQKELYQYTPLVMSSALLSVSPHVAFPANVSWPALLLSVPPQDIVAAEQSGGWSMLDDALPVFLQAAGMTVLLSVLSMPLAVLLGLFVALGRLYGPWPLRWLLACYVEVLRGTPLMLQLFAIFFVLPSVGIRIPALLAAILGLAINYSAYEAEIYRAGLQAIPVGQMEAALALGMSRATALRRIIVPQAFRIVIPPVTNDFIALFKDTSVCSVITVVELTKRYNILANSSGAYLELAALTALLYLLMSYPLALLARRLEHRAPRVIV